jgi:hypothetical protein
LENNEITNAGVIALVKGFFERCRRGFTVDWLLVVCPMAVCVHGLTFCAIFLDFMYLQREAHWCSSGDADFEQESHQ